MLPQRRVWRTSSSEADVPCPGQAASDSDADEAREGEEEEGESEDALRRSLFGKKRARRCSSTGVGVSVVEGAPTPQFRVDHLKEYHASWGDFFAYLDEYMHATRTKVVISETLSVARRNKDILESAKSKRGARVHLLPEGWKTYCRRYICTHGWDRGRRGAGLRQRSQLRARGCTFRFIARVVRIHDEWRIHVPLEMQFRVHTHSVMREVFDETNAESTMMLTPVVAQQQHPASHGRNERGGQDDAGRSGSEHERCEETPVVRPSRNPWSRTTPDSTDGSQVRVLGVKEYHASWEALFEYVGGYMRATRTKMSIVETVSVAQRNKKILGSEKARRGEKVELIPDEWKAYSRRYICPLGRRKRPRGNESRTHCARSTGCRFSFTAHVVHIGNAWCIHVPVQMQVCVHNHPILTESCYWSVAPTAPESNQTHEHAVVAESWNNEQGMRGDPNTLLDIRTIPRDHPMHGAVCALSNSDRSVPREMQTAEGDESDGEARFGDDDGGEDDGSGGNWDRRSVSTDEERGSVSEPEREQGDEAYARRHPGNQRVGTIGASTAEGGLQVEVGRVKEYHASWERFSAYLKEYMVATHTKVVIKETISAARRNKQIMQSKHAQRGGVSFLLPDELQTYMRKYICTHGWSLPSRSQGLRRKKQPRSTGCQFRFAAVAVRVNNAWCIHVPEQMQVRVHNHPVEKDIFEKYPRIRNVPKDHPLYEDVRKMVLVGGKKELIFEYIRKNSAFKVTKRDVANMVCALQAEAQAAAQAEQW